MAESVGSIAVSCVGGNPGTLNAIIGVTLNGNITNRLDSNGNVTGVTLSGPGITTSQPPTLNGNNSVLFAGVTLPGSSQAFTITGLRVAVPSISSGGATPIVSAQVFAVGAPVSTTTFPIATSGATLASSVFNFGVPCMGSPAPTTIDIPTLINTGTASSTVRVTEANIAAFQPQTPGSGADFGVRMLLKLSGYPASATVYVPDVIVGLRAPVPTTAGALGVSAAGGTYDPANTPLLLVRVPAADATGNGGAPLFGVPPASTTSYTAAFQVPMTNGAATVTYEVVGANNGFTDSAQIPVYVSTPAFSCTAPAPNNQLSASLAPVSTVAVATQTDPIPRYVSTVPPSDCSILNDCQATYFPQLLSSPASISLTGYSQGPAQKGFITLTDGGSNQYSYSASVTYGANTGLSQVNWLTLTPTSGVVGPTAGVTMATVVATADPTALLIQGTYTATITIDAGSAGKATIPVTFTVGPTQPTIRAVVNAANGQPGPVTANSFASIYGVNLVPKTTKFATVAVNGFPATVSYDGQPSADSTSQINFLVPAQLNPGNVGVIATVDGVTTNNFTFQLVQNAPAVFNPGILNQNNTVNLASAPGSRGDIIQVFLTGLATPVNVPVSVMIGTQTITSDQLYYVGPVVSIPGLEQINVQVPPSLSFTGNSANLSVCIPGSGSQQTCSPPVPLYLH